MDPNATLRDVEIALSEGDKTQAREAARNLNAWIAGGGFEPDWTRYPHAADFCRGSKRPSRYICP